MGINSLLSAVALIFILGYCNNVIYLNKNILFTLKTVFFELMSIVKPHFKFKMFVKYPTISS